MSIFVEDIRKDPKKVHMPDLHREKNTYIYKRRL